jgi:arginine repressor
MFEKLSRALDAFNAVRVENERMDWHELVAEIEDPLDEKEVLRLIVELYEEAF